MLDVSSTSSESEEEEFISPLLQNVQKDVHGEGVAKSQKAKKRRHESKDGERTKEKKQKKSRHEHDDSQSPHRKKKMKKAEHDDSTGKDTDRKSSNVKTATNEKDSGEKKKHRKHHHHAHAKHSKKHTHAVK